MDFSERLGQVIYATWGFKATGNLEKEGFLEFSPPGPTGQPEAVDLRDGIYSFYMYERNQRGVPVFQSSSLHVMEHCLTLCYGNPLRKRLGFQPLRLVRNLSMRPEWSLVPVDSKPWHGFLGIRNSEGVFFSCKTWEDYLLSALSYVVEYSPLDVLECYLRPDAGPLLSQWVDLEWTPEEDE